MVRLLLAEKKILIVEDNIIFAWDMMQLLKNAGFRNLALRTSGEMALEKIQNERPDLVILDNQLSGRLDGIDVAELILKGYDIPIIFQTANSDIINTERFRQIRFFGIIKKPINEEEFINISRKALNLN